MENKKSFTIRITDNNTGEEETIYTDAIIGGYEKGRGGTSFRRFNCTGLDACAACVAAFEAVEMFFKEEPAARALCTMAMERRKRESE